MQFHEIKTIYKRKMKKRIGRGGKRGTYSGRGGKGQTARAGALIRPSIRDFIKKVPKLRGYRAILPAEFKAIVNLKDIGRKFKEGEIVSPQTLLEKRLIRRIDGKTPDVKILGMGELKFPLKFENVKMSKSAEVKIKGKAGS